MSRDAVDVASLAGQGHGPLAGRPAGAVCGELAAMNERCLRTVDSLSKLHIAGRHTTPHWLYTHLLPMTHCRDTPSSTLL